MASFLRSISICILLAASHTAFAAKNIEAIGSAAMEGGAKKMARELALKDAMRQAMTQVKSFIESTTITSANTLLIESAQVSAAGSIEDVEVIEEWEDEEIYFVKIRANIPEKDLRKPSPAARYKKKVAFLQFDILNRKSVFDFPGIEQLWPRELLNRLEKDGEFIGIDGSNYLLSKTSPGFKVDNPESYAYLAEKLDAQIVVSGVIRDMEIKKGIFFNDRNLIVEIFIHDGISGARISNYRLERVISRTSMSEKMNKVFLNNALLKTEYGKVISAVIDQQAKLIQSDLSDIPFSARIVEVNGKEIVFNAGRQSLVAVGDILMTYRLSTEPLTYSNQNFFLGRRETPIATLAVEQVQPLFAVGKLEVDTTNLFPGDIIRFGR